jgi:3-hydroxyisobutyrate dehydrogenase-like beta-hydroxyacid dehydrogenase
MPEKVAFIGLGDIGLPTAKRVITHGYEVTVCTHRRREPVDEMKKLGAREVPTAEAATRASDIIITMLRDDSDTSELILGNGRLLESAKAGSALIMMSTLSPAFCRRVAEAARSKDIGVLDAPVTGTRLRATTGELGIMVGGDRELLERCRPILETMGKITYCGDLGMGQVVKLVNNIALMINLQGAYEAISWGMKNGADEKLLVELMKTGTANSWVLQNWEFVKSMNVEPPPVTFYLGAKDLEYALGIARGMRQPCPLAEQCRKRFLAGVMELPQTPQTGRSDDLPQRNSRKANRGRR